MQRVRVFMQFLKRLAEWYLGVPPSEPGQGTAWNLSWRTPWPAALPHWSVLLLVLAAVAYVVWVYRRDARTVPLGPRLLMTGLRLAALGLLLVFLTEARLAIDRTGLPAVVVLVDDSASMTLEDQYPDQRTTQAARQWLASAKLTEPTRLNLAKSILTRDGGRFLKDLLRRHKLRVYRFSETAAPLSEGELLRPEDVEKLLPRLRALQAEGQQTRPGPAVQRVLDDLRGTPPSAIIVLTDGIATTSDADKLSTIADAAASKLIPVFTVGLGSEAPARDLQLDGLLADEVAFVGDPIPFTVRLKAYGLKGEPATVVLKLQGSEEELATETVKAGADGEPVKVELDYTPPQKGEFDYVLEVRPAQGEPNVRNNQTLPHHISVRQEPIRVLLADSVPRYEFRYLKHLLEREAAREGNRTLVLNTVLQDSDLEYADEDRTALRHFPVRREELLQYDVIILGDVDPSLLSEAIFENLREFVRDAGGGLVMIAGPRYNPATYGGTALETLLPVELGDAHAPPTTETIAGTIEQGFRPDLTFEGRRQSSIFRFADSEEESAAIWKSLPEFYWLFEAPHLKPGAVAFARHPTRTGEAGPLPVIAMQRYGAGKVLFHATDELWRWRFRRGDVYYGRYWLQTVRYLTRSKLLGKDRGAVLDTDREEYAQGDTITVRLRFLDERLAPAAGDAATVMVERRGGAQQAVRLARVSHAPSVFEGQMHRAAEGSYHAFVVAPAFKDAPPSDDFTVTSESRELLTRNLDRADLVQTARRTRGRYYTPADVGQLPTDLPPGQPVPLETQDPIPLWNRWELLSVFALALTSEWLLRKRWRLV